MRTSEVLRAAKAAITDPQKWCQGDLERDGQVCAVGACGVALGDPYMAYEDSTYPAIDALCRAAEEMGHSNVECLNDEATHAEVMAMFDRAIAAEEAKENPTPVADETLSIMAACDAAAELVADAVMRQEPDYHRPTVLDVARTELFLAAQDTANYFPPITELERDVFADAIREALEGSA